LQLYTNWINHSKDSLKWAFDGQRKMYECSNVLKSSKIENLFRTESINVAVFGPSQIGKTTLILKFIGISNEYFMEISELLRYGRKQGDSATQTAFIYLKSDDDNFYYNEHGDTYEKIGSNNELVNKLKNLRSKIEDRTFNKSTRNKLETVKLKIPKKYFDVGDRHLKINVIDLPGIQSHQREEQEHVNYLVSNIIPICNPIILVVRADHFSKTLKTKIPGFQNYNVKDALRLLPEKFRIIFTYSISAENIFDEIAKNSTFDKDFLLNLYRKEYSQISSKVKIYPLEFGKSWQVLDKGMKLKTERTINSVFDELKDDIKESTSVYNRILLTTSTIRFVQSLITKKLESYSKSINKLEKIKQSKENEKINLNNFKEYLERNISKLEQNYIDNNLLPKFFYALNLGQIDDIYTALDKTNQTIINIVNKFREYQLVLLGNYSIELNVNVRDLILASTRTERRAIRDYINYAMIKKIFCSKKNRLQNLRAALKESVDKVKREISELLLVQVNHQNDKNTKKLKSNNKKLEIANEQNELLQKDIDFISIKILDSKKEKKEFEVSSNNELDTLRDWMKFINVEFLRNYNETILKINKSNSKIDKFLLLVYLGLSNYHFSQIKERYGIEKQ